MSSGAKQPQQIVIVGGGIIGLCTAHSLLNSPSLPPNSTVTIIENVGIASAASGKAGGFISRDWHNPFTTDLARLSWLEHLALAQKYDGVQKWGWRECGAIGLRVGSQEEDVERSAYRILPGGEGMQGETWLNGEREDMSGSGGIAQLDPAQFCRAIHIECTKLGLITHLAEPLQSVSSSKSITCRSLSTNSIFTIPYSSLVIAAGPWSNKICATLALPSIALTNLPGHSILIRPSLSAVKIDPASQLPSAAIFAGIATTAIGVHASTSGIAKSLTAKELASGYTKSPELFPRASGLVFIAGENSIPSKGGVEERFAGEVELPNRLPRNSSGVDALLDPALIARLLSSAAQISPALSLAHGAVLEKEQFCYRPVHADGSPMIGELKKDVYLATAHGPWGITLAPGTGKIVAEFVLKQPLSCDISKLGVFRSPQKSLL